MHNINDNIPTCTRCGCAPADGWHHGDYESHLIDSPDCRTNENAMSAFVSKGA